MDEADHREAELNEAGWWSNWGELEWINPGCYVVRSADFDEPFFNKAVFVSCRPKPESLAKVEDSLANSGGEHHIVIPESCASLSSSLKKRGYSVVDRMRVMQMGKAGIAVNAEVHIRKATKKDLDIWCSTYLLSFYGDLSLKQRALRLLKSVSKLETVTLLLAELDGVVTGVTALYRTGDLLGLYCLGTLQQHRGRGVAHSILAHANRLATEEGRRLVLQSLQSEGAASFYLKAGFDELYAKEVLSRRKEAALGRRKRPGTKIERNAGTGPHLFTGVFHGFEKVRAVRSIFGETTQAVLSELPIEVVEEKGYMHINAVKGSIVVSAGYLKEGDERYLYLDAIHELVHIKQHMDGRELWDRRYKYVERPTELEAYKVAIEEARRIGLTDEQLVDYLKVEWVSEDDFREFLVTLGVRAGDRQPS